jgi:hypothetical protein
MLNTALFDQALPHAKKHPLWPPKPKECHTGTQSWTAWSSLADSDPLLLQWFFAPLVEIIAWEIIQKAERTSPQHLLVRAKACLASAMMNLLKLERDGPRDSKNRRPDGRRVATKLKEEWVKLPKHELGPKLASILIPVCARFGEGQHTARTKPLSSDSLNAPAIYNSISTQSQLISLQAPPRWTLRALCNHPRSITQPQQKQLRKRTIVKVSKTLTTSSY